MGESSWSIDIHAGASPLRLARVVTPALTARDVTDAAARFVADPFLIRVDSAWHLFFEVMHAAERRGAIGHATSIDGLAWRYDRLVLDEPFHLSYPFVFEADGAIWMVPESHQAGAIRLYAAERFPDRWSFVATLVAGEWVEPTLLQHHDRWYLFAATPARHATELHLFEAATLTSPWREHPASPVIRGDASSARPAGRIIAHDGTLLRFAQDCSRRYGERVRAFEIVELTPRLYRERLIADDVLHVPQGARMHHIDAHRRDDGSWLACVDRDEPMRSGAS